MSTPTLTRPEAQTGDSARPSRTERMGAWWIAHRRDIAWIAPVIAVAAVVSFVNIAGSPQRIDDEGTYTAQAYAILTYGELAHYTYWYDHPPLGWIQIAGYALLTGAFARWDVAVLAGREASIVASLIAAILLWVLARRTGLSRPAATAATALFSLSPLALQFHRTVYLDNLAVPWLLLAFVLATVRRSQLAAFAGAAAAFGIAVLTKETFLLALPILAWVMLRNAQRATRRYTLSVAAGTLVLIGGGYLLLAAVKGELIGSTGQVSLLDGVLFQLSDREGSGSLADPDSLMSATVGMWWQLDAVFITGGLVAAAMGVFHRRLRPYAVLLLALTAFMFRPGGYLPVPYVIMLLPFAALAVAGIVDTGARWVRRRAGVRRLVGGAVVIAAGAAAVAAAPNLVTQLRGFVAADLDRPMREATDWLERNAAPEQRLIVDNSMWVDLVEAGWDRENVIWYYKIDTDPEVAAASPNGWRDSDYVITTESMRTFPTQFPEVTGAMQNSVPVATFGDGDQSVDVRRIVPAGADTAEEAQSAAFTRQSELGSQLSVNPRVEMPESADDALAAGHVDARIITVLGALSASHEVEIAGFPTVFGEQSPIARQVEIVSVDGEPIDDEAAELLRRVAGSVTAADVEIADGTALIRFALS
ncbi:glycosyltransferase family 39 protein [Microbacterium sp. SSW1-59]|uniref:ArnT family glycosyltransferase n=1 Tax=Microbacterium xanthum TaxID=3079794 RepID=UPI002AD34CAA|nr:glycosyltransferase family 39 protein [Microbacterium sp. SSW1-59]MDZ8200253.1 glycosyltransferase family 39 protein [Microbacterium sp. SSW1-59]